MEEFYKCLGKKQNCFKTESPIKFDLVTIVSGLMRTGKTYSVVYSLYKHKDKYHIYTNIQNLSFFENLDTSDFLEKVNSLYLFYKQHVADKNLDNLLREEQKKLEFFFNEDKDSLLVIDEAHNVFQKKAVIL